MLRFSGDEAPFQRNGVGARLNHIQHTPPSPRFTEPGLNDRLLTMADSTLHKIVGLIGASAEPELRLAAIQVGGAVGAAKDRGLVKALLGVLSDTDGELRHAAIEALGKLQVEEALTPLVELVRQG